MKVLIILFFFPLLGWANSECSQDIVIFGEASSYEHVAGKIEKVSSKYELPLKLSEHMGKFEAIFIKSKKAVYGVSIFDHKYKTKLNGEFYQVNDLNLDKLLKSKKVQGKFSITIKGKDWSCQRAYEVVKND